MAIIECSYFNDSRKTINHTTNNLGDCNITLSHFAHSLLSLHGSFGTNKSKIFRYFAYLLQLKSDFSFNNRHWVMNKIPDDAYDGIKKMSDIYGAAVTIQIAQIKYGYPRVVCINPNMVSAGSKRPDFLARRGNVYALFESKASINTVDSRAIKDGIDQLNAVAYVNDNGTIINTFNHLMLVCTNFRHSIKTPKNKKVTCKIIDPDNNGDIIITLDTSKQINEYYKFVKEIIESGSIVNNITMEDKRIIASRHVLDDTTVIIGMCDNLYDYNWDNEQKNTVNELLNFECREITNDNGYLFSDGVFVIVRSNKNKHGDFGRHYRAE